MHDRHNRLIRKLAPGMVAAAAVYAGAAIGASLDVLGELRAEGRITITPPGAQTPLHITDTTYAYVNGDRVATGKGNAALGVPKVGALAFAPETTATVTRTGDRIDVRLEAGTTGYALQPGADVRIHAAGTEVTPIAEAFRKVSGAEEGENPLVSGWISVGEDGLIKVYAHAGRVRMSHGDAMQIVETGTQAHFQASGGELIAVQTEEAAAPGPNWALVAGAVLVAGGIAAGLAISADGDGEGVASP